MSALPELPKTFTLRLNAEQQRIMTRLRDEQHSRLVAVGALLEAPTAQDLVRALIDREGKRLDEADRPAVVHTTRGPSGVTGGTAEERAEVLNAFGAIVSGPAGPTAGMAGRWAETQGDDAPIHFRCESGDDVFFWSVMVPQDGEAMAVVNDESISMFKEANMASDPMSVAYYLGLQKHGERFISPSTLTLLRKERP